MRVVFLFIMIFYGLTVSSAQVDADSLAHVKVDSLVSEINLLPAITTGLSLVNKVLTPKEINDDMLDMDVVEMKAVLFKKFNRWLKRSKITKMQYDYLCSEIYSMTVAEIRVLSNDYMLNE